MTNITDKNDYDIIFPSPVLNRGNSYNNLHINNNNQNYNNLILLSPNEDGENSSPSPNYLKKSLSSPNLISPTNKLFNYIRSKDLKSIENFMIEGGDINAKSYYGTTCLHLAVQEGNTKLVKYLLEKNSDPNIAEGVENRTPAHLAASYGFTECLRILLSHGADITVKDSKGQTPLIKACRHNHFLSVQLILDCGGSVKDKDTERGFTPLHHCCSNGDLNCTKLLISFGSSINEPDKLGRSPLFIATCKSRVEVIKLLLENDADFMQKAVDGKTPFSISKSFKEILNLFKKKNKMNKLKSLKEIQMKEWDNKQVITWFTLQSFSKEVLSSLKKLKIKGDQLFSIDDNYLKKNVKVMSSQERADFINKRDMMLHHSDNSFSLHFLTIDYNQIKFCGHLGQGNFAEVKKGIYNGSDVAVKIIYRSAFRDKNKFQLFKQEVSILSQLEHPNILKFMGTCTTGESDYCIITEFMGGGNLRDLIKENFGILNTKGLRRQIIKNVINAMIYLHSFKPQPILHRDLTSHNLLLDKNRVCKLADFGLSRLRDDEHTMTGSVGNLPWVCPEVIMGNAYNEKADVFSFGVVLYELFTGKLPHTGFYPIKYAELVASGYRPSIENIVDPWKKIISVCWSQSPEDRPHFVELIEMVDKIQTFFDNVRDEKSVKENNFSISFSHTSQDVSQFEVPDDLLDNCNQDGYIIDEKK